jgi:hypothetical protein
MGFIDSKVTFGNPEAIAKIWSHFIVDLISFKITLVDYFTSLNQRD